MRQSLKTCVFVVAASGALGAGGGVASADAGAGGGATNSPGVLSGNSIQVAVDTPVNVCGNSVDGGAALNPATGASCGNGAAARRPLHAAPPPVAHRPAAAPARRRTAPEGVPHREGPPVALAAKAAPKHAGKPSEGRGAVPAPRSARHAQVGAATRAGDLAGSALLASTGPGELEVVAGVGGGLLVGGVLLLRRSRTRRS
ncbi:chaplin [Streptomyces caniferus]|uniref:chaplin n=1 Tax=Streptomyces caniferus TaxID=285557 RepID=UPI003452E2C2